VVVIYVYVTTAKRQPVVLLTFLIHTLTQQIEVLKLSPAATAFKQVTLKFIDWLQTENSTHIFIK
jgi:hypothetical protein